MRKGFLNKKKGIFDEKSRSQEEKESAEKADEAVMESLREKPFDMQRVSVEMSVKDAYVNRALTEACEIAKDGGSESEQWKV